MTARDWNAASYDTISDPQAAWGTAVLNRLELSGNEVVLDAGCGTGRVSQQLVERLPNGRLIALDASPAMLDQARDRLGRFSDRVVFVLADLTRLTLGDLGSQQLDAVFSTATFHWVTDHERLFSNLAAVLRPGGQLVAQCGGEGNIASVLQAVRNLGHERAGTWEYASPETTRRRLQKAGFVDIQTWLHDEPTPFDSLQTLEQFIETVCLREHVAAMPDDERRTFIAQVAQTLPDRTIDYVRLNITARRA